MEVKLFNDLIKMSFAFEMPICDIFLDEDPMQIPFKERIIILNSILEKTFIYNDRGTHKIKSDNEAISINDFIDLKQSEIDKKN